MIVDLSGQAKAELASALAYLRQESPEAADRIGAAIKRTIDTLVDLPNRGRHGRIEGTRELVVRGAPYVVVYSVRQDTVIVLSVRRTSRGNAP